MGGPEAISSSGVVQNRRRSSGRSLNVVDSAQVSLHFRTGDMGSSNLLIQNLCFLRSQTQTRRFWGGNLLDSRTCGEAPEH